MVYICPFFIYSSQFVISMNLFANGDFKIDKSWENRANSRNSNRSGSANKRPTSRENRSLVDAGQRILQQPPDILDTHVANHILREFQAEIPPPASIRSEKKISSKDKAYMPQKFPPRQKTNNNGDEDLLSSMANRLKQVEATCNSQRNELKQKNTQIQKLKKQNTFLKGLRENADKKYQQFSELEEKNGKLAEKVKKMEDYLKKYGMKWVGQNIQGKLDKEKMKKAIENSRNTYRMPAEIDIGTIQRRVEELNAGLHSQGQGTQIYSQNGVHKFRKAEPLPMAFYGDGIAIKGFNFYSYKTKESLKILSDLVDGYFPYVLKGKYPNGVFLSVVDMIAQKYSQQQNIEQKIGSLDSVRKNQFKPQSKEQFLNKLPKQIVKNGKIIPIRGEIEKCFSNPTIDEKVEEENENYEQIDGCQVLKTKVHKLMAEESISLDSVCTLKIRTETGKICIVELLKTDKMTTVYAEMKKIISGQFVLMGNFPKRTYSKDETEDMEELGLFPNANLHVHRN